ncbi:hypothetical protein RB595_003746 [Gaeumannomyces hyphopodioides]
MNHTSNPLEGGLGGEASTSGQISRASLFGMYLTLAFCVLTQQQGSLLMEVSFGPRRSLWSLLGLLPLRLWRLNPVACAAEAWLIAAVLSKQAALHCWTSRPFIAGQETAPLRLRVERLLDRVCVVSMALLIMRGHQVDGSGEQILRRILHQSRHLGWEENPLTLPPTQHRETPWDSIQLRPPFPAPAASPGPGLDELLHPGILTRSNGWVTAIGIIAIVVTAVNLAAVTLPWQFRVAFFFMIAGWLAVALLVLLGRSRGFESVGREALAREIQRLSRQLPWARKHSGFPDTPSLPISALCCDGTPGPLVAPVLVYLCYAITFVSPVSTCGATPTIKPDDDVVPMLCTFGVTFTPAGFLFFTRFVIYCFGWLLLFGLYIGFLLFLLHSCSESLPNCECMLLIFPLVACFFFPVILSTVYQVEFTFISIPVFIFLVFLNVVSLAKLFFRGRLCYFFRVLNPVIVGLGIPAAIQLYSPEGSVKPEWLDWLG